MSFTDRIARCNGAVVSRFAEHAVTVSSGESAAIVYDEPSKLAEVYEGQVETSSPAGSLGSAEVTRLGIIHGTRLSISKGTLLVGDFEVVGIEPDGTGITRLILTKDF